MTLKFNWSERTVDCAAAAILAVAVAFSAAVLATPTLAALFAPLAFCVAYVGLGRIDQKRVHRLAEFELRTFDLPPASAGDAGEALSDALADLKRSLR